MQSYFGNALFPFAVIDFVLGEGIPAERGDEVMG
jgi:hypothetical protein